MKLEKDLIVSKQFSMRADDNSDEQIICTLELKIPAGTAFMDLARSVLASEVIKVQSSARKKFSTFSSGHVFRKTYASSGINIDPLIALVTEAKAEGVNINDLNALTAYVIRKLQPKQ